jgi:histidinol dehydrogenase
VRISRLSASEALAAAGRRNRNVLDREMASRVEEIRNEVLERGDSALLDMTNDLDSVETPVEAVRVEPSLVAAASREVDQSLLEALQMAADNIRLVSESRSTPSESEVALPQGHTVTVGSSPLAAAGIYAPGGRASYPSSVLMAAIPAAVAGVERVALVTPPRPDGRVAPVTLAAADLAGIDEVYAVGGAQAIFALAYGTETIVPVDVIAGPGNRWVQEAKRRVFGDVALDSIAGPSDLTVVFDRDADLALIALDLAAQAEHGPDSLVVAIGLDSSDVERVAGEIADLESEHRLQSEAELWLVSAIDAEQAGQVVEAIAPEHLELIGSEAEALAGSVRNAGCVFVGPLSATAFGDYVAGSNHILPTDGSGRSFGPLSVSTFQRSTSRVTLTQEAVDLLADPAAAIANSEGFPLHGLSALERKSK